VIYIVGNHEHYHNDFANTIAHMKEVLAYLPNLHVMEKESLTIGDTTFLAGTLWTDMNREDPLTLYQIREYMNDFRIISNSTTPVHYKDHDGKFQTRVGKFSPEDSVEEHKAMLKFIDESTAADSSARYVVLSTWLNFLLLLALSQLWQGAEHSRPMLCYFLHFHLESPNLIKEYQSKIYH
jgi:hypothetical protein